jgi:hypothetical protein
MMDTMVQVLHTPMSDHHSSPTPFQIRLGQCIRHQQISARLAVQFMPLAHAGLYHRALFLRGAPSRAHQQLWASPHILRTRTIPSPTLLSSTPTGSYRAQFARSMHLHHYGRAGRIRPTILLTPPGASPFTPRRQPPNKRMVLGS